MFPFAVLCAAVLHDPSPADIRRFGFDVRPISSSIPRAVWNRTRENLAELRRPISGWVIYGRERDLADAIDDAAWCERVWDAVGAVELLDRLCLFITKASLLWAETTRRSSTNESTRRFRPF